MERQTANTRENEKHMNKIMTIKSSIKSSGWKSQYLQALYDLVNDVNAVVTHTYAFSKYIFLQELEHNEEFDLGKHISKDFFREVFLSLIKKQKRNSRLSDNIRLLRDLIDKHKESYLKHASYVPIEMVQSQQIAIYESTKIYTSYVNGVALQFGSRLRMFLNRVLKQKERILKMTQDMKSEGHTDESIKSSIRTNIQNICINVKVSISTKTVAPSVPNGFLNQEEIKLIQDFLDCYSKDYKFLKNSIYYDVKVNPKQHIKAYFMLSKLCEENNFKSFNCFPLRRAFIPCHITIDTLILNHLILKIKKRFSGGDNNDIWKQVVDLNRKEFKDQGKNKSMKFRGMIQTDGVSISILKQNFEKSKGTTSTASNVTKDGDNEFQYIEKLSKSMLKETDKKCVLIDPGRRDLIYCMHELSTTTKKITYRYTRNQRARETKSSHFRKLQRKLKPSYVQKLEDDLSKSPASTIKVNKFIEYLKKRAKVSKQLVSYYGNETQEDKSDQENESDQEDKVFKDVDHKEVQLTSLKGKEIQKVANTESSSTKKKQNLLPFRKLRLSSYINRNQADKRLARNLRQLDENAILVFGDWSAPNSKFHELIKGVGMKRMLKKEGFEVLLINEFKTSSICPTCNSKLENFKKVINPRPFRRESMPTVICHGLLRCTNQNCLKANGEKFRLWNRDLAAVSNFKNILCSLRETGERPPQFSREIKTATITASRKRAVSDSSPLPSSSTAKHFKSS